MDNFQLLERLALALAIGLLVGIERGWQERAIRDGGRAAGARTFALVGLLGGLAATLELAGGAHVIATAFIGFAGCLALFQWRESLLSGSASATGLLAGLVTFALGALAGFGYGLAAGVSAIATTVLLAEREPIHAFLARLTWEELRSALLLLAMSFVLLPVLPDRTVDPWQALNPHQLWLMMIVIAAISYAGYICVKLLGERAGLVIAAAAGGLVSSTAVTLAYSRLSKLHPQNAPALAAGIAASWTVSLIRMSTIAGTIAPGLIGPLFMVVGPPALVLASAAGFFYWRAPSQVSGGTPLLLKDPFDLREVLKFGLLLAGVSLAAKLTSPVAGGVGLLPLAALSGIVDVDPITLSVARMAGSAVPVGEAARIILVAAAANLGCKTVVAVLLGERALQINITVLTAITAASAAVAFALV